MPWAIPSTTFGQASFPGSSVGEIPFAKLIWRELPLSKIANHQEICSLREIFSGCGGFICPGLYPTLHFAKMGSWEFPWGGSLGEAHLEGAHLLKICKSPGNRPSPWRSAYFCGVTYPELYPALHLAKMRPLSSPGEGPLGKLIWRELTF